MKRPPFPAILATLLCIASLGKAQENNQPPPGFSALFNGESLEGWHGMNADPRTLAALPEDERAAKRRQAMEDVRKHWRVENGELINDGHGLYLTTDQNYGDIELWIDYRTVPKADSGVYLRGTPQVQIWDTTEAGGKWHLGADKGSGALWNNKDETAGKYPLVLADKPFGQWNRLRIQQVGARTSVWLNGQQVVDHAIMENYWEPRQPLFRTGPIQLQTHGGEIRWRNIFLREIPADEANRILAQQDDEGFESIFNGRDFTGWEGPTENYVAADGVLMCKPEKGGTIYTTEQYGDFAVRLQFKLPPAGNNGLAIRYPGEGDPAYVGMCELQVLDTEHPRYRSLDPRQAHGSAYGMVAAQRGYLRPTGEWNFQEVTVKGSTVRVELNGTVILDADLSEVTEFLNGRPHPGKDRTSGHFGFAGHNDPVEFRNVRIKKLSKLQADQLQEATLGTTPNVHRCGTLFLAGQPGQEDIPQLRKAGIDLVLDLRTPGEIDWDERALIENAGISYQRLPFRAPETLTDEVMDQAREVLRVANSNGKSVLMHCGSANRVGALWLVYRVLDEGVAWPEAVDEAKQVGLRSPDYLKRAKAYVDDRDAE